MSGLTGRILGQIESSIKDTKQMANPKGEHLARLGEKAGTGNGPGEMRGGLIAEGRKPRPVQTRRDRIVLAEFEATGLHRY